MAEIEPALPVGYVEDDGPEESFPPIAHYRPSSVDGEKCGTCLHFLKGVCYFWNAKAQEGMVCNDWKTDGAGKNYATLTEMFHPNGGLSLDEHGDGLIWKEALATGIWAMTPGPGQKPTPKPLIVKYDSQDPKHISLKKLVDHFDQRAVDHVTVPLSHADRVDENTGFVEALKIVEDVKRQGHHKLLAGYRFTEPDILAKVTNGTIANNSVGILFDYVRKRDGKIFPQVLAHIALTNRPWIDGLAPFGIAASEEHEYIVLSAVPMVEEPPKPTIGYTPAHARTREAQVALLLGSGAPLGTPGNKKNWVDAVGGLPRYIREIARALMREHGFTMSHAIATAISRCKVWAATSKSPKVRAKASAAIAEWNAKKAKSHVKSAKRAVHASEELREARARRELFLASRVPGWWKSDLHPRWPKGHPKGGKFLTKGEIRSVVGKVDAPKMSKEAKGTAISPASQSLKQHKSEFTAKVHKLTQRVATSITKGQGDAQRTGTKPSKTSTYLKDDPAKGISMTGKTNQKALLDFVNRARTQPSTFEKYAEVDPETGEHTYSESRRETHEKIIDLFMRKRLRDKKGRYTILDPNGEELTPEETPGVVFSGGGYAAGKGSVIQNLRDANRLPGQGQTPEEPDNHMLLDPDEIKALLPEFQELLNNNDPEANLVVYEEAWDIAQEIQARAQEMKLNMVVDGISNTSPQEMLGRVKSFTDAGYVDPLLVYVDIPTPEALMRSAVRAEEALDPKDIRHIPEVIMRAVHRDVAATIPGVMNGAPDYGLTVEVWDNNQGYNKAAGVGVAPKLIASIYPAKPGSTGGRPQIKVEKGSEALWQALLMKGHESIAGVTDPGPGAAAGALEPRLSKPGGGLTVTKPKAHGPGGPPRKIKQWDKPGRKPSWTPPPAGKKHTLIKSGANLSEAQGERQVSLATTAAKADVKSYMRGGRLVRQHQRGVRHLLKTGSKPEMDDPNRYTDEEVARDPFLGKLNRAADLTNEERQKSLKDLFDALDAVDSPKRSVMNDVLAQLPMIKDMLPDMLQNHLTMLVDDFLKTVHGDSTQKVKVKEKLSRLNEILENRTSPIDFARTGSLPDTLDGFIEMIEGGGVVEAPAHPADAAVSRPLTANPPGDILVDDAFVMKLLFDTPQKPDEPTFVWHARIMAELPPEVKHKVIFKIRERYAPVDFVAEGMARWRKEHGLPEPTADILDVAASMEKAEAVAVAFDGVSDMADDPDVQTAFEDFKRQNEEMYQFIVKPESEGGLGITVDFGSPTDEAYASAEDQADDVRNNKHFQVQSGLGGDHPLLTVEEYDRFRAVHDIFGHTGIGGGFDRHGEYEAWLAHMTMYTGLGATAMSSEYHGVNSSMWAGKGTSTGRAVVLPEHLIVSPWMADGSLRPDHGVVRNPTHLSEEEVQELPITDSALELLLKGMGLDKKEAGVFASKYDSGPLHGDGRNKYQHLKDAQDQRQQKATDEGGEK
jgi:hypothetical protein